MVAKPEFTFVLGTRPEIIKLAPLIRYCRTHEIPYSILHTGQHYSDELNAVFFDQLDLPTPDHNLAVGSDRHGQQTAEMLAGIEDVIRETDPEFVFVQGDTNTVLAGAIAVSKLAVPLGHVEAGLRSFDRTMPEEVNRVQADHAADYLYAPTAQSRRHLRNEGISDDRIFVTGNPIVDAVQQHRNLATEKSEVLAEFDLEKQSFGLLTAHRAENVDDTDRFRDLLEGVRCVAVAQEMDIIYPIHPRARNRLEEFSLSVPEPIRVVEPQNYLDFLELEANAAFVLTDSGGVQEEACILGVPCVTLRDNTERPETLDVGANQLAGVSPDAIEARTREMVTREPDWENPFGDGTAAEQIIEIARRQR
jgi:UDP-N-acetylglucosamine 2-epimerase (non-hydrolysing)